jgi:N-acetylglutamate synthase-like GNAT family acetyltransferase
MPREELEAEIVAGVVFWGYELDGAMLGAMGIQALNDVHLIRHAYVLPDSQGRGIGTALLKHLLELSTGQLLVGTWAAATWAIAFYQRHGFELVQTRQTPALLKRYWTIPDRQVEASVVLARPPLAS